MKIPLHTKFRRTFRTYLYKGISFLIKAADIKSSLDKNEIKKILIIRPNYRIGNIIFLTPLINEIYKEMPDAKIDLVVGMKLAGDILQELPNVDKVISIPRALLVHPLELFDFIKGARKKEYDLAINISSGSLSSQIVTMFVNARYKASFKSEQNVTKLTHAVKKEGIYQHSGHQTLELLKLFDMALPLKDTLLDIKLTQDELKNAKKELADLLNAASKSKDARVIALFRNARFDKKISDEWWNEWFVEVKKLDENIVVVDILSPDILIKLNDEVLEYSNKNLRALGAFFRVCNMYVSADTGPLHLASASQARVLALFNKTNAQVYGTLGKNSKTIDINGLSPKEVASLTVRF
ncbi:glycosyltransferase family 9 protein [Sulfurimonas sp.]